MGIKQSKIVLNENIHELQQSERDAFSSPNRERYMTKCVPLHIAALKGDWEAAEKLLTMDPTLITSPITEGGETALHVAALEGRASFVTRLLENESLDNIAIGNKKQTTALCFAAAGGHVDVAKIMMDVNPTLHTITGHDNVSALLIAALQAHDNVAHYLFSLPDGFEGWTESDQVRLLTTSIESGLFALATRIVNANKRLATLEDKHGKTALEVLATKPEAFRRSTQQQGGGLYAIACTRLMTSKSHKVSAPSNDAYSLFSCLWNNMIRQQPDLESGQAEDRHASNMLFIATEIGNYEFLVELINRYPDFLYKVNASKHSIFHIAVANRHVQIFNLIFEFRGVQDLISTYIDTDGNNILHLAAKPPPQNQINNIPGAALQMQHEVLWYQVVNKIVQPSYRNMKNSAGETPHDLFITSHETMMKEGENQMKQTANACMLVAILITTVVFTAAFTVPGGYDNRTGDPILENKGLFMIFPVSEALATTFSLTSMMMFLSILTSRYAEEDFITSLPFWLVSGLITLFVSIVAMIVAFGTSLLFYQHGFAATASLLAPLVSVPLVFMVLKYPLLITILRCTCGSRALFRSSNRLFPS